MAAVTTVVIKETLYRSTHDDYPIEVAFTGTRADSEDLFDTDPIDDVEVTCTDVTMVLGTVDLTTPNVPKFNVRGGAPGNSQIYIHASNAGGLELCRILNVFTQEC